MDTMSINDIKTHLQKNPEVADEFINLLAKDNRVGVQKIYQQLLRQKSRIEFERKRIDLLYEYEKVLYSKGLQAIAGVDEVGRGPLAGPVVAAAVILPAQEAIMGLDDSKKLPPAKREMLAKIIKEKAISYSFGVIEAEVIDEVNIYQATLKAMQMAISGLKQEPDYLLIDAVKLPTIQIQQTSIIGGDGKSASIAAASIIAKVYRDNLMVRLHQQHPQYGFLHNKGYGTQEHLEALERFGPCPSHRKSFKLANSLNKLDY